VYRVEFSRDARAAANDLPPTGKRALADAVARLRSDPWQGDAYRRGYPPEYRMLAFGEWGVLVYVIAERTRAVTLLDLLWAA
jgi:mRNA-degrading endonuclease RelE of RelBE toxin-antitoxin system